MAKTLQNLIATAIIASTLCSPTYSGERLNKKYGKVGQNSAEVVVESAGDAMGKGLEKGLSRLKNLPTEQEMESTYRLGMTYGILDVLTGKAKPSKKLVSQEEAYKQIKTYAIRQFNERLNQDDKVILSDMNSLKQILENPDEYLRNMSEPDRKFYENLETSKEKYDTKKVKDKYDIYLKYNANWRNLSKEDKLFIYLIEKKIELRRKMDKGEIQYFYPEEVKANNETYRGYDRDRFYDRFTKLTAPFRYFEIK